MKNTKRLLLCLLLVSLSSTGQQVAAPKSAREPQTLAPILFSGFHDFVRTGAGFIRECDPPGASSEAAHIVEVCMAYVLGISDGATTLSNQKRTGLPYCLTPEADVSHLYAAVLAYIKTNPDRADARTPVLVLEALSGFWPCHPSK
jgi:Rap1a immunity proteins